ncbi:apiosidase-like domain-containing protein [Sediminitomix flava]|uniref:Collagenase-like protein with putative collagen-binding domain n=1 Tax=Sediminitomix flava TaxID=379075 RepID=A0A315YXU1_SEDFL|nr:DUF4038 domain-containing protein [Sediminitomix flava]PWJ34968.1 collagenase-like protein with putative collagen-binding domain [Sediminitomix flava]
MNIFLNIKEARLLQLKHFLVLTLFFIIFCNIHSTHAQLRISENKRYLIDENGEAFFWMADTAWELIHRLDKEETKIYLENRAKKGFNVIQTVALAELNGLKEGNADDDLPLIDLDPSQPNEAYFEHLDWVIKEANKLGLYVALLPTWGDKFNLKWGVGPIIFNAENAELYGAYLAKRYQNDKIIWVLGGDRNPETTEHKLIINAMAEGIKNICKDNQLITYHPQGGTVASSFFGDEEWLAIDLFQSGHFQKDYPNFKLTKGSYQNPKIRPVIDAEPCYEDHPINWKPSEGWYESFDVRRAAYWSILSGAAGHSYGNHNIWQMWEKGRTAISSARTPWQQALDHEGAFQMGYMRTFFEQIEWQKLKPCDDIILSPQTDTTKLGQTCKGSISDDSNFGVFYIPYGDSIRLRKDFLRSSTVEYEWFNPRIGKSMRATKRDLNINNIFNPPGNPKKGNDWVLLLRVNQITQK